jgi:hypothetical protein
VQGTTRWKAVNFRPNPTAAATVSSITVGLQADATAGAGAFTFNISLYQYSTSTSKPAGAPLATLAADACLTTDSAYFTFGPDPGQFWLSPNSTYSLALTAASGVFWWQEVGSSPAGCSSGAPTGTNSFTYIGTSLTTNSGASW